MSQNEPTQLARDNRANQLNPHHAAYHRARGRTPREAAAAAAQARMSAGAKRQGTATAPLAAETK